MKKLSTLLLLSSILLVTSILPVSAKGYKYSFSEDGGPIKNSSGAVVGYKINSSTSFRKMRLYLRAENNGELNLCISAPDISAPENSCKPLLTFTLSNGDKLEFSNTRYSAATTLLFFDHDPYAEICVSGIVSLNNKLIDASDALKLLCTYQIVSASTKPRVEFMEFFSEVDSRRMFTGMCTSLNNFMKRETPLLINPFTWLNSPGKTPTGNMNLPLLVTTLFGYIPNPKAFSYYNAGDVAKAAKELYGWDVNYLPANKIGFVWPKPGVSTLAGFPIVKMAVYPKVQDDTFLSDFSMEVLYTSSSDLEKIKSSVISQLKARGWSLIESTSSRITIYKGITIVECWWGENSSTFPGKRIFNLNSQMFKSEGIVTNRLNFGIG